MTRQILNIMLIDDDPVNNLISRETIRHFDPSIKVVEYDKPDEALDFLVEQSKLRTQSLPDVIFLDLNMPLINGWSFLDEYKHILQFFNADIELFLLTSSVSHKDMQKAQSFPIISHYISKPLTVNVLEKIKNDESFL
jgi:CheY-like chemotaxis protein